MKVMPLRHRTEERLPHKLDIKGMAVAIAFLVTVSLFAGGRDAHTTGHRSASVQIPPIMSTEKTDPIQLQKSPLPDSSRLDASR
jgi:hypothetical protein